jgi:hypothetical protein
MFKRPTLEHLESLSISDKPRYLARKLMDRVRDNKKAA